MKTKIPIEGANKNDFSRLKYFKTVQIAGGIPLIATILETYRKINRLRNFARKKTFTSAYKM